MAATWTPSRKRARGIEKARSRRSRSVAVREGAVDARGGLGVVVVIVGLHVLPLALRHTDRIIGLRHGEMLVSAPTGALDADKLSVLYDDEEAHDDDHRA